MTAPPAIPEFMTKEALKPLLRLAKRRAVACAVGLTHDRDALLFLHRRMKPRRAMEELRHEAKAHGLGLDIATLRFGRARIAMAVDSQTVLFTLNKGTVDVLRRALLAHLRPAGFQHCQLLTDTALESEAGGDYDEDTLDEQAEAEDREAAGLPPLQTTPADPPAPDLVELHATLTHLVQELARVLGPDHAVDHSLVTLAREAQACLKAADAAGATRHISRLQAGLKLAEAG